MVHLDSNMEATFIATTYYINKELLYKLAYAICGSVGYEYDYTIFDLAKRIDKIINL